MEINERHNHPLVGRPFSLEGELVFARISEILIPVKQYFCMYFLFYIFVLTFSIECIDQRYGARNCEVRFDFQS